MINVVCVQVGDYCDRGKEYVDRLFRGLIANLADHDCTPWCIADDPDKVPNYIHTLEPDAGVKGWWNKIALFRPGIFPAGERVLYFDLDTVITGDLSDIADYSGKFAACADYYFKGNLNSGMMGWEAGALDHIWRVWDRCGRPQFITGGDQSWIESVQPAYDAWQEIVPKQVVSYKLDCQDGVPDTARVVCYHGKPRPHETELWSNQ